MAERRGCLQTSLFPLTNNVYDCILVFRSAFQWEREVLSRSRQLATNNHIINEYSHRDTAEVPYVYRGFLQLAFHLCSGWFVIVYEQLVIN